MIHNTSCDVSMRGKKYIKKMSLNFFMEKTPVFVHEPSQYGVTDIFNLKQNLMRMWTFWSDTVLHLSK